MTTLDWNPKTVEEKISLEFKHHEVLFTALSDSSYAKEINDPDASNERLAFLGESVIKLAIADYLYYQCPYLQVSNYKGLILKLTEPERYTKLWFQLGLGDNYPFLVGTAERPILRQRKNNPFERAFLALVGAIHDDRGFSQARNWLVKHLISPLLQKYLKTISERPEPTLQVKFLGNTLLNTMASDYIYHRLPGVEVKTLSQWQRRLTQKNNVAEYKEKSQELGNTEGFGFKQFVGETYLNYNEKNNRTAFSQLRDEWVKECLDEDELLKEAIAQLLTAGKPQKWIIRTVLGYASKDYDTGRDRFHEILGDNDQ